MARGQGKGKNSKGKRNGTAKGRSTFLDLPSPTRDDSQPLPQPSLTPQPPPPQAPPSIPLSTLNPHDISWGSELDSTCTVSNDSAPPTPLTDPYQNPTLARAVTAFLQDQRNQVGPALSSPTTPILYSRPAPAPLSLLRHPDFARAGGGRFFNSGGSPDIST